MITTVLVPLDGSTLAARALPPARTLAERTGASLVLLTAWWGDDERRAREHLDDHLAKLAFGPARAELVHDPFMARAILAEAGPAVVVCMSTHGRSGLGDAVLGSVAAEVVRASEHPVLLIGPRVERHAWESEHWLANGNVLCPIDGSSISISILPIARQWAELLGLAVRVVEVVPAPMGFQLRPEHDEDSRRARQATATLSSLEGSPDCELLTGNDPARVLVDYAKRVPATLFAMATHAKRGLARVALGSVTMQVVHRSPIPVLVLPPDTTTSRPHAPR